MPAQYSEKQTKNSSAKSPQEAKFTGHLAKPNEVWQSLALRSQAPPQSSGAPFAMAPPSPPDVSKTLSIQRKCACGGTCSKCDEDAIRIQPKLAINQLGDAQERQADSVAAAVVDSHAQVSIPVIPAASPVGAQRSATEGTPAGKGQVSDGVAGRIQSRLGGGAALTPPSRSQMESRFRSDFDSVRIHTDGESHHLNRHLDSVAFTVGSDIFFSTGAFQPATRDGRFLLAHELTHVVQNAQAADDSSIVRRTTHGPTTPTNCHNWTIPLPPWIAGTFAHGQIAATLAIPPRMIPRASKLFRGIPSPPAITPNGFADLFTPTASIAEIKSTATGSGVAAGEAAHYVIRHDESLARSVAGTGDMDDARYLARLGGLMPGNLLDLSTITGTDLILGPFVGDPLKQLHIEGDSAGAVVYWCTGIGTPGPLSLIALNEALKRLKKMLEDAKKALEQAAQEAAEAIARFGRALPGILRVLLVILLILAIIALVVVAVICALGIPVTIGGSSVCSGAAIGGAAAAAAAILLIIGISAPGMPEAAANLTRAAHPSIANAEAASGADYERSVDSSFSAPSIASATSAQASYNPVDEFLASLSPLEALFTDPITSGRQIARGLSSLNSNSVSLLNQAATALANAGDTATCEFLRSTIRSAGLDRPDALASINADEIDRAFAQLDMDRLPVMGGDGSGEAQVATAPSSETTETVS